MVKRRRSMRRADRREQLLKIARQLVAQEGISALTMTALSELAAVAKPVVYSHFDNAEDVAIELLNQHFNQLSAAVSGRVADARNLEEYVSWLVDEAFDFENMSDTPVRKITNGFAGNAAVNQAFLTHEAKFITHWEALLKHLGVPEETVDVAAYALSGMIDNSVYTYALKPQQRRARDTLKSLLLASIEALAPDARKMKFGPDFVPLKSLLAAKEELPTTDTAVMNSPATKRRVKRAA